MFLTIFNIFIDFNNFEQILTSNTGFEIQFLDINT